MNREIKFRVWDVEKQKIFHPVSNLITHKILLQFTNVLDCNGKEIYEGDIVKNFQCHHIREGRLGVVIMGQYEYAQWCIAYPWKELDAKTQSILKRGEEGKDNLYRIINNVELYEEDPLSTWGQIEVVGNIFENKELIS